MKWLILFVYSFTILYTGAAHSYSKVCIILSKDLDIILSLPADSNSLAVAISTCAGAFGKIIGSYFESVNLVKLSGILFLFNAVAICGCIWPINFGVFIISRTLQGLISGMHGAISFGCMGLLENSKEGFANFGGIGAVISATTIFFMSLCHVNYILYAILCINIFAGILFLFFFRKVHYVRKISIISSSVMNCITNEYLWILSLSLGCFLGISLHCLMLQKTMLHSYFGIQNHSLTTLAGIGQFIVGFFFSILYRLQELKYAILLFIFVCICFYFSFLFSSSILFILANSFLFGVFSLCGPLVANIANKIIKDPYIVSTYFFAMRSIFTSLSIWFMSLMPINYTLTLGFCAICIGMIGISNFSVQKFKNIFID